MKKIIALVLSLTMIFVLLAGCNNNDTDSSASNSASASSSATAEDVSAAVGSTWKDKLDNGEEVLIGVIAPEFNNEASMLILNQIKTVLEPIGCTVSELSAEADNLKCIALIEDLTAKGAAAICVFPMDIAGYEDAVAKAEAAGTMVFFFGEQPEYYCAGGIISDYTKVGEAVAEMGFYWVDQQYPDAEPNSIGVYVGGSLINQLFSDYKTALNSAVKASEKCYVAYDNTNHEALSISEAYSAVETAFTADSNIKVFLVMRPDEAIGIQSYLETIPGINLDEYAIFAIEQTEALTELVDKSATGESAVRGIMPQGTDSVGTQLGTVIKEIFYGELEPPYWASLSLETYNTFGYEYEGE